MKNIVITGASGVVGSVLAEGLESDFSVTSLSKSDCDTRIIDEARNAIKDNTDVIIHLAWKDGEIYKDGHFDHDNILMALNILEVATEKNIPRVILASSVHANEYRTSVIASEARQSHKSRHSGKDPSPSGEGDDSRISLIPIDSRLRGNDNSVDWPTSIYGATKIYIESLGKYYAKFKGLDVIAVRLGGVNQEDSPTAKHEVDYEKIFLTHADLISNLKKILQTKPISYNFMLTTLVSDPHFKRQF